MLTNLSQIMTFRRGIYEQTPVPGPSPRSVIGDGVAEQLCWVNLNKKTTPREGELLVDASTGLVDTWKYLCFLFSISHDDENFGLHILHLKLQTLFNLKCMYFIFLRS